MSGTDGDAGGLMPGMPDLGGLMESLQKVQEARSHSFEGVAGGGAVRISALGDGSFQSVRIAPDVVEAGDVDLLEDLVLAALHDLTATLAVAQREAMGALGSIDIGGMLGGLAPAPEDETDASDARDARDQT